MSHDLCLVNTLSFGFPSIFGTSG